MKKSGSQLNKYAGLFIRLDKLGKTKKQNEIDLSNPATLIWLTVGFVVVVFFLIIGVPWHGYSNPIPPEDLDVVIPVLVVLYILIVGGFYFRDKKRKKRDNDIM